MVYSLVVDNSKWGAGQIEFGLIEGDGDPRLVEVEDPTPDGGLRTDDGRALISGRRVKTDHFPSRLMTAEGSIGVVADFYKVRRFLIVSPALREIVERFEPGVHQFEPVQIVNRAEDVLADMFIMVVCNRLDSVDREHTPMVLWRDTIWSPPRDIADFEPKEDWPEGFDPTAESRLFFSSRQIGEKHLWRDKHLGGEPFNLSSALAEAFLAAGMTGMTLTERREV